MSILASDTGNLAKPMEYCFICGSKASSLLDTQSTKSVFSGKRVAELIQIISGFDLDPLDSICDRCMTKLNEYDEYSTKASDIQTELRGLLQSKTVVKQELKDEFDDFDYGGNSSFNFINDNDGFGNDTDDDIDQSDMVKTELREFEDPVTSRSYAKASRVHKKSKSPRKHKDDMDKPIFACPFPPCDKRFNQKSKYDFHLKLHSKERPYQCTECGKFYKTNVCLRSHHRAVHKNANIRVICDRCGDTFARKPGLLRHLLNMHLRLKPFVCQICGSAFGSLASLQVHQFVHNKDDKPFECTVCQNRFHTKSKLSRHMKSHGEKEYQCPICHRMYSQRYNLTAHIKTVHDMTGVLKDETAPPIICQLCGKVFDRNKTLQQHLRNVHEAVPITSSFD